MTASPQPTDGREALLAVAQAICKSPTCEGISCCQGPAQRGRTECPVKAGAYDDAARAALGQMVRGEPPVPQPTSPSVDASEPVAHINKRLEDLAEANTLYGKDQRRGALDKIARNDREISWLKDLRSIIALSAPRVEPVAWHPGSEIPPVEKGREREYIVAVYRVKQDKVYTFSCSYLNLLALSYDDCPLDNEAYSCKHCTDDGCPTTGWYYLTGENGEGGSYFSLDLRDGDELRGWREIPQWEALAAHPAPPYTGWQPIETAPKDGTEVLICGNGAEGYFVAPTHWMPLPPIQLREDK